MSNTIKTIIVTFCVLISFAGYSQNKIQHFTSDSSLFFKEMEQFLTYSRKQDGIAVMDEFSWTWFDGKYSDKQREEVYKISNIMLKKRKKAFPDFQNYILLHQQHEYFRTNHLHIGKNDY